MYEKILERSEGVVHFSVIIPLAEAFCVALDDRIEELSELIREHYNIAELGDPASGTDVCAIMCY